MGWHGNTRAWCMRLTCASLAPVLSMVVLDLAGSPSTIFNWRLRVLSGLCTRKFNSLGIMHPVFIAHLRCAFLTMSGGHHVNACFDKKLCLRDGAGDHDRLNEEHHLSLQRSPFQPSCQSCRLALHRGRKPLSAPHWLIDSRTGGGGGFSPIVWLSYRTGRGPRLARHKASFENALCLTSRLMHNVL